MKRTLKYAFGIFAVVALIAIAAFSYYGRPRTIDFAEILPDHFTYCGDRIDRGSEAYGALAKWMVENQGQWHRTPATFVPRAVLESPNMLVNIMAEAVVVNFNRQGAGWQQMARSKSREELAIFVCKEANKSVKPFASLTRTLSTPHLLGHGFAIVARASAPG